MTSKSLVLAGTWLATACCAVAMTPTAFAQDTFRGVWTIVEVTKPDWVDQGSTASQEPMAAGETVDFRSTEVVASGALRCAKASYQVSSSGLTELFRGKAGVDAKSVAESLGLTSNPRTLRVNCSNGETFAYHEGEGRIVTLQGTFLYTLMRSDAR